MVKKFMCAMCGTELEYFYDSCPHCNSPFIGWEDEVGGWHEGGCGTMPDGTDCGECSRPNCGVCAVWLKHKEQLARYIQWNCPDCGKPLKIYVDEIAESQKPEGDGYLYEKRFLIRHCEHCGADWENEWTTQWGDMGESALKRKFWG